MSDQMLEGVLRIPLECWNDSHLFKVQMQGRCVQAADRIKELKQALDAKDKRIAELEAIVEIAATRDLLAAEAVEARRLLNETQ